MRAVHSNNAVRLHKNKNITRYEEHGNGGADAGMGVGVCETYMLIDEDGDIGGAKEAEDDE